MKENNIITWFDNIKNKKNCTFIQLDVKEFQPSVTEEIRVTEIIFTNSYYNITVAKLRTIKPWKNVYFPSSERQIY